MELAGRFLLYPLVMIETSAQLYRTIRDNGILASEVLTVTV